MEKDRYNPQDIEPKWQKYWLDNNIFSVSDDIEKRKMYILDMFPYPSGDGLHVGHAKIYTASDVVSRYLRMKGFEVLHPTGWDAFGLPTENSAIKKKVHPAELTKNNVNRFRKQMQRLGLSYDWNREINTTDPEYYKWTQWIFLQLFRMGLAYEDTIPINWCPSCKTGLANEEVVDGKCDRCGTEVEQKPMRQWMLKITKYADQLLEGLGGLDWPKSIIESQQNWIGRSEGTNINFEVDKTSAVTPGIAQKKMFIEVFTTRADTLYGVTYFVLAPEHPLVDVITTEKQKKKVLQYLKDVKNKTNLERTDLAKEKTGVFTGGYVLNPMNNEKIPVWVADYVLMSYGTGAIMSVPGHDERDYEFAKKFDLPIKQVISPVESMDQVDLPYIGEGVLIDSDKYNGVDSKEAKGLVTDELQAKGKGSKAVNYKLHDWVFSRQRYWGEPIPIIHCEKCGAVPVPEDQLPVELPPLDNFEPSGTGESPLAKVEDWVKVKCPTCPNFGRRETNTMPQWAGSSWYFIRYADPHNQEAVASENAMKKWLPVDVYIGGAEHAVLHLLYARFWTKALYDAGVLKFNEPFKRLRNVGLIMGEDGQKMSKSRGNVVNPDDVIKEYGADTLRVYEMFLGPFNASTPWNTSGIVGSQRFLGRVWKLVLRYINEIAGTETSGDDEIYVRMQQTIKKVSESTEQFKFNTAISALMEMLNTLEKKTNIQLNVIENYIILLSPYAPFIAEELWQRMGHEQSITKELWPDYDEKALKKTTVTIPVQVNGRVRGELSIPAGSLQEYVEEQSKQLEKVLKYLNEGEIVKIIFVPDKMINFVLRNK